MYREDVYLCATKLDLPDQARSVVSCTDHDRPTLLATSDIEPVNDTSVSGVVSELGSVSDVPGLEGRVDGSGRDEMGERCRVQPQRGDGLLVLERCSQTTRGHVPHAGLAVGACADDNSVSGNLEEDDRLDRVSLGVSLKGRHDPSGRQIDNSESSCSSSDGGQLRVGVRGDRGNPVLEVEPVVGGLEVLYGRG